jgi:mono/diheme cytochrome c family protein
VKKGYQVKVTGWLHTSERSHFRATIFVCLAIGAIFSCRRQVRDWQPSDHDRELVAAPSGSEGQDLPNMPPTPAQNAPAVGEDLSAAHGIWVAKCVGCHGSFGHGDGPLGAAAHTPDFSEPGFAQKFTDDQLTLVISGGRGMMPANPDLPPETVRALVQWVRHMQP